jgi:glycosyltransferase involved in cell wall biosynthesis
VGYFSGICIKAVCNPAVEKLAMRILIPVLGFAQSGGYRVLSELASVWQDAGHHVSFLTAYGSDHPYFPTRATILSVMADGQVPPLSCAINLPQRFRGLRLIWSLYRGLRQIGDQYDIILCNHNLTVWPVFAARLRKAQLFYYIQADEAEYYKVEKRYLHAWLARQSYRLPLNCIVNAPLYMEHIHISAIGFVPPGLDLNIFSAKSRQPGWADNETIVLGCIGRSEQTKGTRYVLDAFTMLHASDPRFRLRVAYGNLPDGWAHPAAEIVVPGNDSELADYYRGIDILIAPGTVQHGAPHYPVMEAMACGTPVVTTGYMPANTQNSWIVANRSAQAIAEAVKSIATDPNAYERVLAARTATESFAWSIVAAKMLSYFQQA